MDNNDTGLIVATPVQPVRQAPEELSMEPVTLKQAINYARFISKSELVPEAYRGKDADIVICIQMGNQLGFGAGQSLKSIAVIKGTPTLWGDGLLALCLASPLCLDIREDNTQTIEVNQAASCTVLRKGHQPYTHTYTAQTAHDNGLWKRWVGRKLDPYRMLQLKARNFACRNKFADLLMGLQAAEDVEDYQAAGAEEDNQRTAEDSSNLTDAIISKVAHAVDIGGLDAIALHAKKSKLPDDCLDRVRDAYRARRAYLAPPEEPAADAPAQNT